jgi:hypothetical protein
MFEHWYDGVVGFFFQFYVFVLIEEEWDHGIQTMADIRLNKMNYNNVSKDHHWFLST